MPNNVIIQPWICNPEMIAIHQVYYATSLGHMKLAFAPSTVFSPYVYAGIDLVEGAVLLFSEGNISPQVDYHYGYGLRIHLPGGGLNLYSKTSDISGNFVQDGVYRTYGIEFTVTTH